MTREFCTVSVIKKINFEINILYEDLNNILANKF